MLPLPWRPDPQGGNTASLPDRTCLQTSDGQSEDSQYHLIRLRGIVQRFVLIPHPEKFLLPIPLADIRTQFHKRIVHGCGHCVGSIQVAGALDGDRPLVVGTAGRTPRTVLLLHAKGDLPILSNTVVTAGLSGRAGKASADTLRRQLSHHAVGCDPVNGMCPLPGVVGAEFCVRYKGTVCVSHYSLPSFPFSALSWSCSNTVLIFSGMGSPRCPAFSSRLTPSLEM